MPDFPGEKAHPINRPVFKGYTPATLTDIAPGQHQILIRSAGYVDYSQAVTVNYGQTTPLAISMQSAPAPTASKQLYTTKYGSFMSAYAPIDDAVNDSAGNTTAVLAIDMSEKDYNNFTSQAYLILLTGLISMIFAVGAIFFFGARRDI